MKKMCLFSMILFAIAILLFTTQKISAQQCSYSDYVLDVESVYNKNDKSLDIIVTNPEPLLSEGEPINLTSMKISIYNGDEKVKEETYNNVKFAPGEKKSYKLNNLPDSFGTDIATIVITGQIAGSYNLGIGSIINVGVNLPSGIVCGDDVVTNTN